MACGGSIFEFGPFLLDVTGRIGPKLECLALCWLVIRDIRRRLRDNPPQLA